MTINQSAWTGMVQVDDTALAVTDTGGPGIPVIYLNGQFATQGYWRRVIAELGTGWRHITYDERARGKSKRSADYSFEAAVRDVDAVLAARRVNRALLWAGPTVRSSRRTGPPAIPAVPWAVLVDGTFPHDWLDEAMEQRIWKLFRRLSNGSDSSSSPTRSSCERRCTHLRSRRSPVAERGSTPAASRTRRGSRTTASAARDEPNDPVRTAPMNGIVRTDFVLHAV